VTQRVHVQVRSAAPKLTREQKPYCELSLADACDRMTLRVWSDHPAYKSVACALTSESFIELTGEFSSSQYGLDCPEWTCGRHGPGKKRSPARPAELRAKQNADWQFILENAREDQRSAVWAALCDAFVKEFSDVFGEQRGAEYHHARRGGLVEAYRAMMRVAMAIGRSIRN